MKNKLLALVLASVMLLGLVACSKDSKTESTIQQSGAKPSEQASGEQKSDKPIRVAILYTGFLGDKSYNDSCHLGAEKAKEEYGVEIKEFQSKEPAEWETNFLACVSESNPYDLIIGSSSQYQQIFEKHCPDYPDQKFAIIDGVVKGDNIVSSTFAQNEGSFLAGAVAAMMTTKTDIPNINEQKIIGWVGGQDVPVLQDFFTGYKQGAKYIDPDVEVLQSFAGSFSDPIKGKELTLAQYNQGADIVMNVASGTGTGILEGAKEAGKYAIGVDLNQDDVYPGHIITSMLKRIDVASHLMIESVVQNKYQGGTTTYLDIASGGVGLTDFSTIKTALGDKFPEDVLTKVQEIEAKVKSGEIKVDAYEGFGRQ